MHIKLENPNKKETILTKETKTLTRQVKSWLSKVRLFAIEKVRSPNFAIKNRNFFRGGWLDFYFLFLPLKDRPSGSFWRRWWFDRRPRTCRGTIPSPRPTSSGGRGGERGIRSPEEQRIQAPASPSSASGVHSSPLPPPSKFRERERGERERERDWFFVIFALAALLLLCPYHHLIATCDAHAILFFFPFF